MCNICNGKLCWIGGDGPLDMDKVYCVCDEAQKLKEIEKDTVILTTRTFNPEQGK